MTFKKKNSSVQTFCMVAVFAVFAVLAVLLTLTGARVYRDIATSMRANNALRSSLSYVSNKLRSCNEKQTVLLLQQEDIPVLTIKEDVDGDTYLTRIFFDGEYLKEFASVGSEDAPFSIESGDKIAQLNDFTIKQDGNLLVLTATAEDMRTMSLTLNTDF